VLELESYDPARLIEIIDGAAGKGYRVLCIDSLSHFWNGKDGELDKVDRAARRMQTPNSFAARKQVTPLHNALIDKIVSAPLHILAAMRAKTEWILDSDERTSKTVPRKVGLAPVMRDGIEYEFDVCGDMVQENTLIITKSRCPKLAGGVFPNPERNWQTCSRNGWEVCLQGVSSTRRRVWLRLRWEKRRNGVVLEGSGSRTVATFTEELSAIWKRMCSPRGGAHEFDVFKASIEALAGSAGMAEFYQILRQQGVSHPRSFGAPNQRGYAPRTFTRCLSNSARTLGRTWARCRYLERVKQ
jgi:hypothetical protein